MGKCKTKTITDLDTFKHNQAHSKTWHIKSRGISRTLTYSKPETFKTLVYSESRCIENSAIFKIKGLFRHLRCQTFTMKRFVKTVNRN